MMLVGAVLLGRHVVALPKPPADPVTTRAFAALRNPGDRASWLAAHVLYAGCRCSARVVDHLAQSSRIASVHEVVLWVGHDSQLETRLTTAGFRLLPIEPEALHQRFGVEAAPLLVVLDPNDRARYVGGYTTRKQGPDIQDRQILAALLGGATPEENPVLGCAVSSRLQTALNPIGVP
jgi:hypothetical protein